VSPREKWQAMTEGERNDLLARKIMGWHSENSDDHGYPRPGFSVWVNDQGHCAPAYRWHPCLNRDRAHEVLLKACEKVGQAKVVGAFVETANEINEHEPGKWLTTELQALMFDPSDLCLACLQACHPDWGQEEKP
jgi:hypothetical protein